MEFKIGIGLTCFGIAIAIAQWLIPPDKLDYQIKFAFVVLAILFFLFGIGLLLDAWRKYYRPAKSTASRHIKGLTIKYTEYVRPYYQVFESHQQHLSTGDLYYGRVGIYNHGTEPIDGVSVKLHAIMPDTVGRHDLPLQFMHDTVQPYTQQISLASMEERLVDVVVYFNAFAHDHQMRIAHTVPNAKPEIGLLPIRDYSVKIIAYGRGVEPVRKQFRIGVKDKVLYMTADAVGH